WALTRSPTSRPRRAAKSSTESRLSSSIKTSYARNSHAAEPQTSNLPGYPNPGRSSSSNRPGRTCLCVWPLPPSRRTTPDRRRGTIRRSVGRRDREGPRFGPGAFAQAELMAVRRRFLPGTTTLASPFAMRLRRHRPQPPTSTRNAQSFPPTAQPAYPTEARSNTIDSRPGGRLRCPATDPLEECGPVGSEPRNGEPSPGGSPSRASHLYRQIVITEEPLHPGDEMVRVGRHVAGDAILDHGDGFGGGERHHRHSDHHRLTQSQTQAGVSDRTEEESIIGREPTHHVGRHPAQTSRRTCRAQTDEIELDVPTCSGIEVVAQPPPASGDVVDGDDPSWTPSSVQIATVDDSVFYDRRRHLARVPHESVERGDVHD